MMEITVPTPQATSATGLGPCFQILPRELRDPVFPLLLVTSNLAFTLISSAMKECTNNTSFVGLFFFKHCLLMNLQRSGDQKFLKKCPC